MNAMPFFISIYVKELFILSITPPPPKKHDHQKEKMFKRIFIFSSVICVNCKML